LTSQQLHQGRLGKIDEALPSKSARGKDRTETIATKNRVSGGIHQWGGESTVENFLAERPTMKNLTEISKKVVAKKRQSLAVRFGVNVYK